MKNIYFIVLLIFITGCNNQELTADLNINCNDMIYNLEVKQDDTLSCELLGEQYEFKIKSIKDDKIYIETDQFGLTNDNSLLNKEKEFTIKKGESLTLTTQSLDYQESMIFNWK